MGYELYDQLPKLLTIFLETLVLAHLVLFISTL